MEVLKSGQPFVIYGAQVVAYGAYRAISYLYHWKPECFIVSDLSRNPPEIEGIPVQTPDHVSTAVFVIVAVTELLQKEITAYLRAKGFQNVFLLTHHEEHLLMSAYFSAIGRFPATRNAGAHSEANGLVMYVVKSRQDAVLHDPPIMRKFEKEIQAGAALTQKRFAECSDDIGENISAKNRQYCEMSAAYWIWKNTDHPWTGIEHYRRRLFVMPEMLCSGVDAILPLPYVCYPNTVTQFRRFVSEDVFQSLLRALRELHPTEYADYQKIIYGPYQYTYNLFCARREVFCDYCAWFFEITEYMEQMDVPEIKMTRALSYVAEVLTNLYFMYNGSRWKILHVEKGIYV